MKSKKKSWGGKRKGAGRPSKGPTKTLAYRVPLHLSEKINTEIKNLIAKIKSPDINIPGLNNQS